jgi:hypothetical protein
MNAPIRPGGWVQLCRTRHRAETPDATPLRSHLTRRRRRGVGGPTALRSVASVECGGVVAARRAEPREATTPSAAGAVCGLDASQDLLQGGERPACHCGHFGPHGAQFGGLICVAQRPSLAAVCLDTLLEARVVEAAEINQHRFERRNPCGARTRSELAAGPAASVDSEPVRSIRQTSITAGSHSPPARTPGVNARMMAPSLRTPWHRRTPRVGAPAAKHWQLQQPSIARRPPNRPV